MSGVVEFLLQRLAEDEAELSPPSEFNTRAWADVAAKRRIVEAGPSRCLSHDAPEPYCDGCQAAESASAEMDWVVRTLATAYSSHPDYDKAWRP